MAKDMYIVPLDSFTQGITPFPHTDVNIPGIVDMVDFRCSGNFIERIGFKESSVESLEDGYNAKALRQGDELLLLSGVTSFARLDLDWLIRVDTDALYQHNSIITQQSTMVEDYVGYNGAVIHLDYPCGGKFIIHKPGTIPMREWDTASGIGTINTSAAYPCGGLLFSLDQSTAVYGVQPHLDSFIALGDMSVGLFTLGANVKQKTFSSSGILSKWAWAGDSNTTYFLGKDKNLWVVQNGQPQRVGYSWLWREYSRAWLSYIPETGDLFIVVDKGDANSTTFVEPKGYIFNGGLSRLTVPISAACYLDGDIYGIGIDGKVWEISAPLAEPTKEYNWDDYSFDFPTDAPDIITEWSSFGVANTKSHSGFEAIIEPFHPVFLELGYWVLADLAPSTDLSSIKTSAPVAETEGQGNRFRYSIWVPTYDEAGPIRLSSFKAHIKSTDLWGIWGVTVNPS